MAVDEHTRHTLLSIDARGYGGSDDNRQHDIQSALPVLLDSAAAAAGLDRARWHSQPAGDGELSVLPAGQSEVRLVDDFVWAMHAGLRRHNRDQRGGPRLRMRLAVHHGMIRFAPMGFSGQGAVEVSRLADSDAAHRALDRSDADLVLIVSERVFEDTIRQPHTAYDASWFRRVEARKKEFVQIAYLYLPGHDIRTVDLGEFPEPSAAAEPVVEPKGNAAGPVVQNTIDTVRTKFANFGFTQHG